MLVFSVVNQKGGVGKTTTAVNLATALTTIGLRTLLLDMDPQGNASTNLGLRGEDRIPSLYNVLIDDVPLKNAIRKTDVPHLFVAPSVVDMSAAEIEIVQKVRWEYRLKDALSDIDDFDLVFIDCPPSLGPLTVNALVASSDLVVPVQCEFFALEGLSHLLKTVDLVRRGPNKDLELFGVVLTMFDGRSKLNRDVEQEVRNYFGEDVFDTIIPRNIKLSEAPSHSLPAIIYDMNCKGSFSYIQLAKEFLSKLKRRRRNETKSNKRIGERLVSSDS